MISLSALLHAVILLVIVGLVFWLFSWLIDYVGLPEPFRKVARCILAVVAVLVCVSILLGLAGMEVWRP